MRCASRWWPSWGSPCSAAWARSCSAAPAGYQYAFTNLAAEDGTEASALLRQAGIPFRLEAGGAALSVPADKLYDVRLLLAGAGLPRGGGVGFELFDRGDLGVSEFTQKVNLRRATEGELARTIGHLAGVRSARVHLTFEEGALYREDQHHASAAVVLNLQPGKALGERELAGAGTWWPPACPGSPRIRSPSRTGRARRLGGDDEAGSLGDGSGRFSMRSSSARWPSSSRWSAGARRGRG